MTGVVVNNVPDENQIYDNLGYPVQVNRTGYLNITQGIQNSDIYWFNPETKKCLPLTHDEPTVHNLQIKIVIEKYPNIKRPNKLILIVNYFKPELISSKKNTEDKFYKKKD